MRGFIVLLIGFVLSGCVSDVVVVTPGPQGAARPAPSAQPSVARRAPQSSSLRGFEAVVRRVEPVAERVCRSRTRGVNCDYDIVLIARRDVPPNAFYTLDRAGRPVIGFTLPLVADMRNADELAFVFSHEAAHHIAGHIQRGRLSAATGASLAGALASLGGGNAAAIREAQEIGAFVGSRRYSKQFELEADALGAQIAERAGFDAVRGARYFTRAPDPGNQFLGTHPPNADRIAVVRQAVGR